MIMNEQEFQNYWYANRTKLLNEDAEYIEAKEQVKANGKADWLFYVVAAFAGISFMSKSGIQHELLNWFLSAVITIVCFLLCVFIKSLISNDPSLDDIEKKVRQRLHDKLITP